jgi:hypothetical protein
MRPWAPVLMLVGSVLALVAWLAHHTWMNAVVVALNSALALMLARKVLVERAAR